MIGLLLAALSMSSPSVVDAERAYAAMAQKIGQWTAFRATAAPKATLFVPDPVPAADFLKGRKDPPVAVKWQPSESYLSCDGRTGANLGPWQRPTSVGYFVTVWTRYGKTWRWNVDFGDALETPMPPAPSRVPVYRASCTASKSARLVKLDNATKSDSGSSRDHSLAWTWRVDKDGARHIFVYLWNGRKYNTVIDRTIAAS